MEIIKNDKTYSVTEFKSSWTVSAVGGKLSVSYNVSKDICATLDELRDYVKENNLF